MYWTADANAKLFIGVLDQMRGKLKLDYEVLAAHMGSDCTACAVEQHIVKLKRQANKLSNGSAKGARGSSNKSTPTGTPTKRQADQTPMTPTKKVKEDRLSAADLIIIKEEVKPKVKTEITGGVY
ncbi:hypothetical protein ASPCADRAFT_2701 [Aspergillus carbonarius ITEM 5010]|uniref:Uncharacterized protein n=1 Tax=Aspergillus carbonarius (strain ITEM 5010) TaxID=602072 RepID=A0A1R3RXS3_ASPC5|nr:hypothetical protein ASPCADRAFT_2701 [Aspergillus carbonarius ITEM 5010]